MSTTTSTKSVAREGSRAEMGMGIVQDLIDALENKYSELSINFQRTTIRMPLGQTLEIDGGMIISLHMRELSEEERQALAKRNVALTSP